MGTFSLFHWVITGIVAAIWVFPMWRLLERTGRPGALALLAVFPPFALLLLWVLAFGEWQRPKALDETSTGGRN
jgi:hypothetical protein